MEDTEVAHFKSLTEKINKLLQVLDDLKTENTHLTGELKKYQEGYYDQNNINRISELQEEISELKKENKSLKEKERLVRKKVERLAVKLETIEI